jgi:hypothetical protein
MEEQCIFCQIGTETFLRQLVTSEQVDVTVSFYTYTASRLGHQLCSLEVLVVSFIV